MIRRFVRSYSSVESLKRTPLYDFHLQRGAKMVDFAGYAMPVLYSGQSHIESHNWVREHAGLFDVSHMLQHRFHGPDAVRLLEKVTPGDIAGLKPYTSTLSALLNEEGGIVDDTIITKHTDTDFYTVTNAGRRDEDLAFFKAQAAKHGLHDFTHEIIPGGLLALQGPQAARTLAKFTSDNLADIGFGESSFLSLLGGKYHVARGGYTGEDGFEISIPDDAKAVEFAEALTEDAEVKPIGLAARDSLRLEAGMCLYGHDLNEQTSPVAARLAWIIGKARRKGERADFNGAAAVLGQLASKDTLLRTGLVSTGPAPREGAPVTDKDGNQVGEITSGSMSPTLGKNVAMAYLPRDLAKKGTELNVVIRGKSRPATVATMPFVEPKYYRKE